LDDKPHESKHIAFMSSQVLNGEGTGIVIRCGDNTFIGKINSLAAGTKGTETTLQQDITRFIKFISALAITMAVILFSAGLGRRMTFPKAFVNGVIVVLVANIPQVSFFVPCAGVGYDNHPCSLCLSVILHHPLMFQWHKIDALFHVMGILGQS
jgi:hypothetical protein